MQAVYHCRVPPIASPVCPESDSPLPEESKCHNVTIRSQGEHQTRSGKKTVANWINESNELWQVKYLPSTNTHRSETFLDDIPDTIIDCKDSRAHVEAHLTTGQNGNAGYFQSYPSFEQMSGAGLGSVLSVVDIMVARKGDFNCIIEICATNPVSDKKLEVLERRIITKPVHLIEIDADWVMKQSALTRPHVLVAKRLILLEPNYMTLPYRDELYNPYNLSHEDAVEQEAGPKHVRLFV
jgi:hypothetical protein